MMHPNDQETNEPTPFNSIDAALRGIPEFKFLAEAIAPHSDDLSMPMRLLFALDFLNTTQLPDGSWQHGIWHTSLALIALSCGGQPLTDRVLQHGINFLIDAQKSNGSWKDHLWETAYASAALHHLCERCGSPDGKLKEQLARALRLSVVWLELKIEEKTNMGIVTSYELDRCIYVFSRVEECRRLVPTLVKQLLDLARKQHGRLCWNASIVDTATGLRALIAALPILVPDEQKRILEGKVIQHALVYLTYNLLDGASLPERIDQIRRHGWGDSTHTGEVVLALQELLEMQKTTDFREDLAEKLLAAGVDHLAQTQNLTDGGWFSRVETTAKTAWFIARRFGDINRFSVSVPAVAVVRLASVLKADRDRLAWELLDYRKNRIQETPDFKRVASYVGAYYRVRMLAMVFCFIVGLLIPLCFYLGGAEKKDIITTAILGPLSSLLINFYTAWITKPEEDS